MILARSPFILDIFPDDITIDIIDYVTLDLTIWQGDKVSDKPLTTTISLRKNKSPLGNFVVFDISPLVADYLKSTFRPGSVGDEYVTNPFWVEYEAELFIVGGTNFPWDSNETVLAFNGFLYTQNKFRLKTSVGAMIDVDTVYSLKDNLIRIPVLRNEVIPVDVEWFKDGDLISSQSFPVTDDTAETVVYLTQQGEVNYDNFKEKILSNIGAVFEDNPCNDKFFDTYSWGEADLIKVSDREIKVEYISECRYTPYKVTFYNRRGALEDFYFFKKTTKSSEYTDEVLKRSSREVDFTFDRLGFTYQRFNTNSRESYILNTGFYPEDINETVNQLMLSEFVWLTNIETDEAIPVIIESKRLTEKTSLNDKLINYTITFKYAHDVIEEFF